MSSIPTAEEVLKNWQSNFKTSKPIIYDSLIEVMKEFAKLHVQKTKETLYSKEDVLKAGEIGEINHFDYKHIVSLLDEAKAINKSLKQHKKD